MRFVKYFFVIVLVFGIFVPAFSRAAEIVPDQISIIKAKVVDIKGSDVSNIPIYDVKTKTQTVDAVILEGDKKGEEVTFKNDFIQLKTGDVFFLNYTVSADTGQDFFSVEDVDRLPVIYFFVALFIVLVLLVGGVQGVRGLISLAGSFVLIMYVLLPSILHGYSPILVSIGVSSLIIVLGSYVTHGFNKTTSAAVIGMIGTVIVTGIMAYVAVHVSEFSGYASEEAVYLNLNSRGSIDLVGILIGGIMIGLLGILYDVAIGQAISVEELHKIAPHIPRITIFKRAMRMGREHIGALVNTLAIAYVGASLPLLLLFSTPPVNISMIVNREIFSTEIIRALIGSIGLVLAVPIVTLLSVYMLIKKEKLNLSKEELKKEENALSHFHHSH
ncbi:MAG: YibE/F family protein [Patescibacteria group bacterium]